MTNYEDNTISWGSVSNASGYIVQINTNEYEVTSLHYTPVFEDTTKFTFRIKAKGNTTSYLDSEWSDTMDLVFYGVVTEITNNPDITGIGRSIDVVKANGLDDIKLGASVFDEEDLQNLTLRRYSLLASNGESFSSMSMDQLSVKVSAKLKQKSSLSGQYGIFSGSVSSGFSSSGSVSYSSYASQYYFHLYHNIDKYSLSLPNYSNYDQYTTILSSFFLSDLDKVKNGTMTMFALFDKYGTHVIASGIYGGKLEMFYSVVTNSMMFSESTKTSIDSAVSSGIRGMGSSNASVSIDISQAISSSSSSVVANFSARGTGGSFVAVNSFEAFSSSYSSWYSSFNDDDSKAVLIDISQDGLIGLWDLLPQEYQSIRNAMIESFDLYAQNGYETSIGSFRYNIGDQAIYTTSQSLIRSSEYEISDSGRFNQKYDTIDILDRFGINVGVLMNQGFTKMDVLIELNVKEVDDGYQWLFLFSSAAKENAYLLDSLKFTHSDGTKDTNYWVHHSDELHFDNIDLSKIRNNEIFLRYGAEGNYGDNWKNKELKITLVFKK